MEEVYICHPGSTVDVMNSALKRKNKNKKSNCDKIMLPYQTGRVKDQIVFSVIDGVTAAHLSLFASFLILPSFLLSFLPSCLSHSPLPLHSLSLWDLVQTLPKHCPLV